MKAFSKTNLFLRVVGKRPDSFHELEILFNPLVSPCDVVEIEETSVPGVVFSCSEKTLETRDNLCVKAAEKYFFESGVPCPGLSLHLEKHIPVAAGMGGGSSDAAAVLKILNGRYELLSPERMRKIALELGSDVPFFLNPVLSKAAGRGERLTPLDGEFPPLPLLMTPTHFPVPASWAYNHIDYARILDDGRSIEDVISAMKSNDLAKLGLSMRNDLEYAVLEKFPILDILSARLYRAGALRVMVSGSGPALVSLFPDFTTLSTAEKEFGGC